MSDRPIPFSAPMVRALLDGRKTQTRRILKPQPYPLDGRPGYWNASGAIGGRIATSDGEFERLHRFAKGDRLWVREAWHTNSSEDWKTPSEIDESEFIWYVADGADGMPLSRKRAPFHMPRWASRLTLTVTDVRVQRLIDINEIDAMAEGIIRYDPTETEDAEFSAVEGGDFYSSAVDAYEALWNRINGELAWAANPWVVAVTFTVERRNIDERVEGAA